jgi:hypothetical protein
MPLSTLYQSTAVPPWLEAMHRTIAERSEALAKSQYPKYTGEVIAEFAPQTWRALSEASKVGQHIPHFEEAARRYGEAHQPFSDVYRQYMNPYNEAVVEDIARLGGRSLRENILPQLEAQYIGLGQNRSSRHDELRARHARDVEENILREQHKALAHGFEHAGEQHHREQLRGLETGRAASELGRYQQAAHAADVESLQNAGLLQQQRAQNILNEMRSEHLRQSYYPHQMLQQHMGIMQGVPQQGITSQGLYTPVQQIPQVNTAGQLGSLAAQLYGASQMGGQRRAHGGSVQKQKPFGLSQLKFKSHNKSQKHKTLQMRDVRKGNF